MVLKPSRPNTMMKVLVCYNDNEFKELHKTVQFELPKKWQMLPKRDLLKLFLKTYNATPVGETLIIESVQFARYDFINFSNTERRKEYIPLKYNEPISWNIKNGSTLFVRHIEGGTRPKLKAKTQQQPQEQQQQLEQVLYPAPEGSTVGSGKEKTNKPNTAGTSSTMTENIVEVRDESSTRAASPVSIQHPTTAATTTSDIATARTSNDNANILREDAAAEDTSKDTVLADAAAATESLEKMISLAEDGQDDDDDDAKSHKSEISIVELSAIKHAFNKLGLDTTYFEQAIKDAKQEICIAASKVEADAIVKSKIGSILQTSFMNATTGRIGSGTSSTAIITKSQSSSAIQDEIPACYSLVQTFSKFLGIKEQPTTATATAITSSTTAVDDVKASTTVVDDVKASPTIEQDASVHDANREVLQGSSQETTTTDALPNTDDIKKTQTTEEQVKEAGTCTGNLTIPDEEIETFLPKDGKVTDAIILSRSNGSALSVTSTFSKLSNIITKPTSHVSDMSGLSRSISDTASQGKSVINQIEYVSDKADEKEDADTVKREALVVVTDDANTEVDNAAVVNSQNDTPKNIIDDFFTLLYRKMSGMEGLASLTTTPKAKDVVSPTTKEEKINQINDITVVDELGTFDNTEDAPNGIEPESTTESVHDMFIPISTWHRGRLLASEIEAILQPPTSACRACTNIDKYCVNMVESDNTTEQGEMTTTVNLQPSRESVVETIDEITQNRSDVNGGISVVSMRREDTSFFSFPVEMTNADVEERQDDTGADNRAATSSNDVVDTEEQPSSIANTNLVDLDLREEDEEDGVELDLDQVLRDIRNNEILDDLTNTLSMTKVISDHTSNKKIKTTTMAGAGEVEVAPDSSWMFGKNNVFNSFIQSFSKEEVAV